MAIVWVHLTAQKRAMHALSQRFELPSSSPLVAGRTPPLIEDLKLLGRFRSKMAQQEQSVNVARMMFDKAYAFDRIAIGHSSADVSLQRVSLQLFSQYTQEGATH
jgi:hypothetical protein